MDLIRLELQQLKIGGSKPRSRFRLKQVEKALTSSVCIVLKMGKSDERKVSTPLRALLQVNIKKSCRLLKSLCFATIFPNRARGEILQSCELWAAPDMGKGADKHEKKSQFECTIS